MADSIGASRSEASGGVPAPVILDGQVVFRWKQLIDSELDAVRSDKNTSFHGFQPYRSLGNPGFQRSGRPGGGKNLSWHRYRTIMNVGNSDF